MKAMSHHLRSDLCVAVATEEPHNHSSLPKLDILAVHADDELHVEREADDDVKGGLLARPKLPVQRKCSICGRCTSMPPKQRHQHERNATQSGSNMH